VKRVALILVTDAFEGFLPKLCNLRVIGGQFDSSSAEEVGFANPSGIVSGILRQGLPGQPGEGEAAGQTKPNRFKQTPATCRPACPGLRSCA